MTTDTFEMRPDLLTTPMPNAVAAVPHDVDVLDFTSRGIFVGTTGDLAVVMAGSGATVVFRKVQAGIFHPIRATAILSTGTTAVDIVVGW